jgi:uncharacterized protein
MGSRGIVRCVLMAWLAVFAFMPLHANGQTIPLPENSFIQKLKLARAGDDTAQLAVGMHYEFGADARQDAQQAARWYREATLRGNIEAQYRLARLIGRGAKGLTADKAAAVTLLLAAAEKGHAASQNDLGLRLQNGDGIPADIAKAGEWYRKSADQNYAPAQVNLGLLMVRGIGVAQDYATAYKLFSSAAAQGDAWAMNNLGSLNEMGWGTPKDLAKARENYTQAAAKGNALAQQNLARLDGAPQTIVPPQP